jgi:glyoxylase I family protein
VSTSREDRAETAQLERLHRGSVTRAEVPGGKQIQIEDPDGNPIELFEPARR